MWSSHSSIFLCAPSHQKASWKLKSPLSFVGIEEEFYNAPRLAKIHSLYFSYIDFSFLGGNLVHSSQGKYVGNHRTMEWNEEAHGLAFKLTF